MGDTRMLPLAFVNRVSEDILTPQQIIDACNAVWEANKSNCSGFVRAVASPLGVTLFDDGDDADSIVDKLTSAPDWGALPDLPTVEANASAGWFIIAGMKSTEFATPRANGHVIVVVQGDDPNHPGFPMAYWGMLGGVGQENSSIRNTFNVHQDLPNVHYFGIQLP
jgi:hypothetical protein